MLAGSECSSAMLLLRNNRRPKADFPRCAPAVTDRLATARCATRPGVRLHPLQMQKLVTEKFHWFSLVRAMAKVRAMANNYHVKFGKSVTSLETRPSMVVAIEAIGSNDIRTQRCAPTGRGFMCKSQRLRRGLSALTFPS
jgi:hypothetical protein